eukprot:TRINITY_DN10823_c0_g1_i2.p1 TRINITY_DN10823_c0_g1~~TRINITY_DN10823_c0_g1_i2.p1  ORF type:complete len:214 (-),score=25.25 TRINITY_DN10823_c0_g1_i2:11-652(-)
MEVFCLIIISIIKLMQNTIVNNLKPTVRRSKSGDTQDYGERLGEDEGKGERFGSQVNLATIKLDKEDPRLLNETCTSSTFMMLSPRNKLNELRNASTKAEEQKDKPVTTSSPALRNSQEQAHPKAFHALAHRLHTSEQPNKLLSATKTPDSHKETSLTPESNTENPAMNAAGIEDSKVVASREEQRMNYRLSLIHICRCRRYAVCRSRWSPYH